MNRCEQHLGGVGDWFSERHCRFCGNSIAAINAGNRNRHSTYTVPSVACTQNSKHGTWTYVCITTQHIPWHSDEWIEVVW